MQGDPALHPDADGSNFVLVPGALVGPPHPHADALITPLTRDVECAERADDPFLQRDHEAADIGTASLEVEHHISDALAGAVIGELPAPPCCVDWEARRDQIAGLGARSRSIERRMLEEPDELARLA
jgi:hypothetical protein